MLVDTRALVQTYEEVKQRAGSSQAAVLMLVANDVDSLCAARMMQVRAGAAGQRGARAASAVQVLCVPFLTVCHAAVVALPQALLAMDHISFRITPVAGYLDFRSVFEQQVADDENVGAAWQARGAC